MTEKNTVENAAQLALEWCATHEGWQRICDIADYDSLYKQLSDMPAATQAYWRARGGEEAWREITPRVFKESYMRKGFISSEGKFYPSIKKMPPFQNFMTVFKTSKVDVKRSKKHKV